MDRSILHVTEDRGELLSAREERIRKATTGWLINQRSPNTRHTYQQSIQIWMNWCANHNIDPTEPTRHQVAAWVTEQEQNGYAPNTIALRARAVKSWHRELTLEGARSNTDCHLGVKLPRVPDESQARLLADDEVIRLLKIARTKNTPAETAIALMALMGLRCGEAGHVAATALQASSFGTLLMVKGKGGKNMAVPCPQLVLDAAARHGWPGDDLHLFVPYMPRRAYKRVTGWLRPVVKESGITDFHPHMLRHWYATVALREGVAERHVQASMRHANADTTRRYDRARDRLENHATFTIASVVDRAMLRDQVLPPPTGAPANLPPPRLIGA